MLGSSERVSGFSYFESPLKKQLKTVITKVCALVTHRKSGMGLSFCLVIKTPQAVRNGGWPELKTGWGAGQVFPVRRNHVLFGS